MSARELLLTDLSRRPPRADTIGPVEVRQLRGAASRAAFARRVGVTPHTVYRWELPDGAAEARRPRGVELERLKRLARGEPEVEEASASSARALPSAGSPPLVRLAPPEEDVTSVLPALERVLNGDWRKGHGELVQLVATRTGLSPNARALARFGMALIELLQRSDSRAALVVIAPALADAEAGLLTRDIAGRVFSVAALAHALPDASLFELGRVHAYAARVEALAWRTDREAASLSCVAALCAGTLVGDKELLERAYTKLDEAALSNLPELLDVHIEEFKALRPVLAGKLMPSTRAFEIIAERAEQRGYVVVHARALGHLAMRQLENLADPEGVLELSRRAKQLCSTVRVGPGLHTVFPLRAEIEALLRLGRTAEARTAVGEIDAFTAETGIVPVASVSTQTRLFFLTGAQKELRLLADRLYACDVPALRPISHAYAAYVEAVECMAHSGDKEASVAAFERAESQARGWPFLLRDVLLHRGVAHIVAGQEAAARTVLRRAQRFADSFPSAWVTAHLRRVEGMLLATTGKWAHGRQLLDSAIATFDLAHDLCDAALCRHILAAFSFALDEPKSESEVLETRGALERLGVEPPRALHVGLERLSDASNVVEVAAPRRLGVSALVVPIQRLAVRGAVPALILREFVSILAHLFPEHAVRLEEIDSAGTPRLVSGSPGSELDFTWVEFSDGAGRLLRVGLSGVVCESERASLDILAMTTALALEAASLRGGHPEAESVVPEERALELPGFVAASQAMRKLRTEIARLANSRATVIITGESGSGKDVVARAIHELSERAKESYIAFNCATVPRDLFEGQLFGYRRGAFTGAASDQLGVIRAADGGTLFLDEIAELPLDIQPKLLRFLENSEVFPLGERKPIRVDVRVIAATHRNLAALVREGRFREDLYYRLQVVPIHVRPLRERREDIPVLARYFVRELSRQGDSPVLAPDALAALAAHDWPGNVRELRNVIERALAFSPTPDVLRAEHLRLVA